MLRNKKGSLAPQFERNGEPRNRSLKRAYIIYQYDLLACYMMYVVMYLI